MKGPLMSAINYTKTSKLEMTMQQVMGALEELSLEAAYSPLQPHCFEILSIEAPDEVQTAFPPSPRMMPDVRHRV